MTAIKNEYYAHGKLLITGEYLVLEGAKALAVPLKLGQKLTVSYTKNDNILKWNAHKPDGIWFNGKFDTRNFSINESTDIDFAKRLKTILQKTRKLKNDFLIKTGASVETSLKFDPEYGFGSSSTLIVNIAKWANIDPFELQKETFKGSGYDIACGIMGKPLIYKLDNGNQVFKRVNFHPSFSSNLYFVYLGKKQRSLDEINKFRKLRNFTDYDIERISEITDNILSTEKLTDFERLLSDHEKIISKITGNIPIGKTLFKNYQNGIVKSLGAWGGDFVLVTTRINSKEFREEMKRAGFNVVFGYDEIVKP